MTNHNSTESKGAGDVSTTGNLNDKENAMTATRQTAIDTLTEVANDPEANAGERTRAAELLLIHAPE